MTCRIGPADMVRRRAGRQWLTRRQSEGTMQRVRTPQLRPTGLTTSHRFAHVVQQRMARVTLYYNA